MDETVRETHVVNAGEASAHCAHCTREYDRLPVSSIVRTTREMARHVSARGTPARFKFAPTRDSHRSKRKKYN